MRRARSGQLIALVFCLVTFFGTDETEAGKRRRRWRECCRNYCCQPAPMVSQPASEQCYATALSTTTYQCPVYPAYQSGGFWHHWGMKYGTNCYNYLGTCDVVNATMLLPCMCNIDIPPGPTPQACCVRYTTASVTACGISGTLSSQGNSAVHPDAKHKGNPRKPGAQDEFDIREPDQEKKGAVDVVYQDLVRIENDAGQVQFYARVAMVRVTPNDKTLRKAIHTIGYEVQNPDPKDEPAAVVGRNLRRVEDFDYFYLVDVNDVTFQVVRHEPAKQ